MNLISAANISKAYTERWLFKEISFGLAKGEKLALVGSNGTGKSTLLKVICGQILPDGGEVGKTKGLIFGYLPQEPELDPNKIIEESLFSDSNPVLNLVKEYEKAIVDMDYKVVHWVISMGDSNWATNSLKSYQMYLGGSLEQEF